MFGQLKNGIEVLSIKIMELKNHIAVNDSLERSFGMISFSGYCDNEYFKGEIQPKGYDNIKKENGITTLSARYMLVGKDCNNDSCHIFIENNAIQGAPYSEPKIFTDSKALDFLNTSKLSGQLDFSNNQFYVRIYVDNPRSGT